MVGFRLAGLFVSWLFLLISWYPSCLVGRLINWLIGRFVSNNVVDWLVCLVGRKFGCWLTAC